jgi:hypothetical protein
MAAMAAAEAAEETVHPAVGQWMKEKGIQD